MSLNSLPKPFPNVPRLPDFPKFVQEAAPIFMMGNSNYILRVIGSEVSNITSSKEPRIFSFHNTIDFIPILEF